jgi:molybdopterin adenylyltransferase
MTAKIGFVTVSDRASTGVYQDLGGPAMVEWIGRVLTSPWEAVTRLIPDDQPGIEDTLRDLVDNQGCCLVLTTGGTGPAPRDVTPEATEAVCDKMMPGFGELMRQESLKVVPTAILSRQTAGIRGKALIVNLPGKPSAISDCLTAVMPAIPYCVDLIGGAFFETDPALCKAFRPKQK